MVKVTAEIGLYILQGGDRDQQLGQFEYSVGRTWQLEVLGVRSGTGA